MSPTVNVLELTPVKIAAVEAGEKVTLIRPRPSTAGLRAPFHWIVYWLAPKRLRLDEVGSFCWRRIDGRTTMAEIASAMRDCFGERVEPAEERLGRFIQSLRREELVGFSEIDGPRAHQESA